MEGPSRRAAGIRGGPGRWGRPAGAARGRGRRGRRGAGRAGGGAAAGGLGGGAGGGRGGGGAGGEGAGEGGQEDVWAPTPGKPYNKELSTNHFEDFAEKWADFDRKASSTMPGMKLALLLAKVERPLGLKGSGLTNLERMKYVQSLNIDSHGEEGIVHYIAVLQALCRAVMGEALPTQMVKEIDGHTAVAFPSVKNLPEKAASYTEIYATVLVQARLRGYIHRKRMKTKLDQAKKNAAKKVQAVSAQVLFRPARRRGGESRARGGGSGGENGARGAGSRGGVKAPVQKSVFLPGGGGPGLAIGAPIWGPGGFKFKRSAKSNAKLSRRRHRLGV